MVYFVALALAAGLALPIAVLAVAISQSRTASAALEGMARQPEAIGRIQTAMILSLAFIESLAIFVFLTFLILQGRLPDTELMIQAITGG